MSGRRGGRKGGGGLILPIKGSSTNKSKIMIPVNEQHSVTSILKKNAKNIKKSKAKNSKLTKSNANSNNNQKKKSKRPTNKSSKFRAPKGTNTKSKKFKKLSKKLSKKRSKKTSKKGKKKSKKSQQESDIKSEQELDSKEEEIDPYIQLKSTEPNALIRMFLHKLIDYPFLSDHLCQFGAQLQSNMINFIRDMILPQLMALDNVTKFESIINDRKLIYLLRQSFIRWLLIHKNQIKLLFKRKGDENAQNKLKYNIIVNKNHIISKLTSTLTNDKNDIKNIINKLDIKTKMKYFHYLKSDIKNPFLAQLMTPIPKKLLSNVKCNVPSLSGKMPNIENKNDMQQIIHGIVNHENEQKDDEKMDDIKEAHGNGLAMEQKEEKIEVLEYDNMQIQNKLHNLFDGYKDCVLLSEKQILVDILKTQYKLIQNAIDDYGKIRWMDAPIDHGHVRLMQRELIRDHELIIKKCRLIEYDYKKKLLSNINEINLMRSELNKRKNIYLSLIENKCYRFLKEKLSQIHEEIERKKQAIALHEKKRENYLNHAKESLKNEQNMRKGVKLVNDTYHKYLRQLTRSKIEYAQIDNKLTQEQFYRLQEKLNNLRNKNDRYWYWYKKEKEIYTKSIKTFSRMNRFFKKIEEFLIAEYGESSTELQMFRQDYYLFVLKSNVHSTELNNEYNKEIFEKKKISDIEIVYNMKKKDINLPRAEPSVINRLYKQLKPNDLIGNGQHQRNRTEDQSGMFLNNQIKKHQDQYGDDVMGDENEDEENKRMMNEHINDSDEDEEEIIEEHKGYTKTNDDEIFANVKMAEPEQEEEEVIKYDEYEQLNIDDDEYGHRQEENDNDSEDDDGYQQNDEYEQYNDQQNYGNEAEEDDDGGMTYEDVINHASNARSSGKLSNITNSKEEKDSKHNSDSDNDNENENEFDNTKEIGSEFLLTAEKTTRKKGKRITQNVWKGKVESTVFYGDGNDDNTNVNMDISAGPHIAKHYTQNNLENTFEDSTQFHDNDDEYDDEYNDPNRPSSTIFKNEPNDDTQFFPNNQNELKEEVEPDEDEDADEDVDEEEYEEEYEYENENDNEENEYEHRIKISENKHEKAQNSVSVSGFGDIGASYGYDDDNDNGFDIPPPPPPQNEHENDVNDIIQPPTPPPNEYDNDSDNQFDDNMEHNVINNNDEDMGDMSFEDTEEDSSYVDSDEDD